MEQNSISFELPYSGVKNIQARNFSRYKLLTNSKHEISTGDVGRSNAAINFYSRKRKRNLFIDKLAGRSIQEIGFLLNEKIVYE